MNRKELTKLLGSCTLVLLIAGCATSKETLTSLENSTAEANKSATSAQDAANQAKQAAGHAQTSADSAQRTADEAIEKARMALEKSENNEAAIRELNEKIDRIFKKTMHK